MSSKWTISRRQGTCSASGRAFEDGERHVSLLEVVDGELTRSDLSLDAWREQGMPQDVSHAELFDLDPPGKHSLGQLGWCEAPFQPVFETKVLEDRGEYEVVQDAVGRHVLFFKGRRNGFMPEYVDHPVKDMKTWEELCKWRLDPNDPARFENLEKRMISMGMPLGMEVEIMHRRGGSVVLVVGTSRVALGAGMVGKIMVEVV